MKLSAEQIWGVIILLVISTIALGFLTFSPETNDLMQIIYGAGGLWALICAITVFLRVHKSQYLAIMFFLVTFVRPGILGLIREPDWGNYVSITLVGCYAILILFTHWHEWVLDKKLNDFEAKVDFSSIED